jgi:hypothetical protein
MMTEHEVRRHLKRIQALDTSASERAHMLLQLGRRLRRQARALSRASDLAKQGSDSRAAHQLERLAQVALGLYEEIRGHARRALAPRPKHMIRIA